MGFVDVSHGVQDVPHGVQDVPNGVYGRISWSSGRT